MSRTDLDATTLANSLRMMAGDGSMEWVTEPIQANVLLDIADMLAENAKLRELVSILCFCMQIHNNCDDCKLNGAKGEVAFDPLCACNGLHELLRDAGIEVPE